MNRREGKKQVIGLDGIDADERATPETENGVVSLDDVEVVEVATLESGEFDGIFSNIEPTDKHIVPYLVETLYTGLLEKGILPLNKSEFKEYVKRPQRLAYAIVDLWRTKDTDGLNGNTEEHLALALAYAIAIVALHSETLAKTQTPMDAVHAKAVAVIDYRGVVERYQKGWEDVLHESLRAGELHPALLYLNEVKWLALCESSAYKKILERALENLKSAMPEIIEIIAPKRIKTVKVVGLGGGDGEKDYEVTKELLAAGLDVDFRSVDASPGLLKTGMVNMVRDILKHVIEENPQLLMPTLREFCVTNKTEIESEGEGLSEEMLTLQLKEIVGKFTTPGYRELVEKNDYELFNHLTAAILGLHTSNKTLLEKLNALRRQLKITPNVSLFRKVEPEPEPVSDEEIAAAAKTTTIYLALGNAPLGNNPLSQTLEMFDRLIRPPTVPEAKRGEKFEEEDIDADYMLLGVHIRPENVEANENLDADSNPYASSHFIDFATHPLKDPGMIQYCDSNTHESLDFENVGELLDPKCEKDEDTGYYRQAHWFKFARDVIVKTGKKTLAKKDGDLVLTHYSYSFALKEAVDLLAEGGYQPVYISVDESGRDAKILIRKMTRREEKEKLSPKRTYRVLRRLLPREPEATPEVNEVNEVGKVSEVSRRNVSTRLKQRYPAARRLARQTPPAAKRVRAKLATESNGTNNDAVIDTDQLDLPLSPDSDRDTEGLPVFTHDKPKE